MIFALKNGLSSILFNSLADLALGLLNWRLYFATWQTLAEFAQLFQLLSTMVDSRTGLEEQTRPF